MEDKFGANNHCFGHSWHRPIRTGTFFLLLSIIRHLITQLQKLNFMYCAEHMLNYDLFYTLHYTTSILKSFNRYFLIFNKSHEKTQGRNKCILITSTVCVVSLIYLIPLVLTAPLCYKNTDLNCCTGTFIIVTVYCESTLQYIHHVHINKLDLQPRAGVRKLMKFSLRLCLAICKSQSVQISTYSTIW